MNVHEHQAKAVLRRFGVAVPEGMPAVTAEEAEAAARRLIETTGRDTVVVKAQIHAGGRGKAGGVKVVKGASAAAQAARALLGTTLVTRQTGSRGRMVRTVLIEQGLDISRELYAGLLLDRGAGRLVVMTSSEGGVEIEEVAARTPEKILRETVDPALGLAGFQARNLSFGMGLSGKTALQAASLLLSLHRAFVESDASLVEVNPLVITGSGAPLALDCKMAFDDNALFRHPDIEALRDPHEEEPAEVEARQHDLSFVKLDGNIGCMVNGAGLAMATMDIVKHFGGEPANFLDVGGSATADRVSAAFRIITADPAVKGIFVNIFGGIMKCDVLAEGLVGGARRVGLRVPLMVRLEGTNVQRGMEILASSGLPVTTATDLADGARRIVELVRRS